MKATTHTYKFSPKSLLLSITLIASTLLAPLSVFSQRVFAAGSLYLSPGSKTVQLGTNFTVQVRANVDSANAAQVTLNYPADQIDYVSNSLSGSSTPMQAVFNVGGGTYDLAATVNPGPGNPTFSGDVLIATITFRPKVASGSGSITFAGGSALVKDGAAVGGGGSGITLNYTGAPAAPAPKAGTPAAPAAPPADITAPTISELAAASPSPKEVNITWKTDEASSSVVEFGLDDKLGLAASVDGNVLDHVVPLNSNYIEPGLTVYYRAKSTDAAGNIMTSEVQQYIVPGVSITLTVKNKNGKPVSGATVSFNGEEKKTDREGKVTFDNVPVGAQSFEIKKGKVTEVASVEIGTADAVQAQDVQLNTRASLFDTMYILVILGILLIAGLLLMFLKKRDGGSGTPSGSGPSMPWKKDKNEKPKVTSADTAVSTPTTSASPTEIGKIFTPESK